MASVAIFSKTKLNKKKSGRHQETDSIIKAHGRWCSSAYIRYISVDMPHAGERIADTFSSTYINFNFKYFILFSIVYFVKQRKSRSRYWKILSHSKSGLARITNIQQSKLSLITLFFSDFLHMIRCSTNVDV